MAAYMCRSIALLMCLSLGFAGGCTTTTGGGGSTDTTGDTSSNGNTSNDNSNTSDDGTSGDASPGFAAFTAGGCAACHPSQATDFSDSTTDDIVDTLLGDIPHPGGDFGDLTEQEIDDITDFIISVMLGDEALDGSGEPDDIDTNGSDADTNGTGGEATPSPDWFDQVWRDFDYNYSHFETKGIDWNAVRVGYEPQFMQDMNEADFLDLLAQMLAELHDLHVWLFDSAGEVVEVYSRPATPNYPNFYPDGVVQMGSYPLWHGMLDGNIAFISIETFESSKWEGLRTGEVDDLFATYAGADAMIVDVRFNNGGDENIARVFASHLTDSSYVYGYHRSKISSPDHNEFGDFVEHRIDPAENAPFLNPAACLIGERNMSSAEWFVLMMKENPRSITLIGDTTRGSSGSPQEYSLPGGIKYYIPSWEAYRADQTTPIEDVGIAPDPGFELSPEASYSADRDFVIERAIDALTE